MKLLVWCVVGLLGFQNAGADVVTLTISAAASLRRPLEKIQREFEKLHPSTRIVYNFGSSGALKQQVVNGAPVDIFISAAAAPMDELERIGLIDPASRFVMAGNTLVLIASPSEKDLSGFAGLAGVRTIAIGEPKSVPAGAYAIEVFDHFDMSSSVRDKLVSAKDVRQVLVYVESGNAEAGIVYGSDALGSHSVRTVAVAPPDSHTKIEYPAAVIVASRHRAAGEEFLAFLRSPSAQSVFQAAGFMSGS